MVTDGDYFYKMLKEKLQYCFYENHTLSFQRIEELWANTREKNKIIFQIAPSQNNNVEYQVDISLDSFKVCLDKL